MPGAPPSMLDLPIERGADLADRMRPDERTIVASLMPHRSREQLEQTSPTGTTEKSSCASHPRADKSDMNDATGIAKQRHPPASGSEASADTTRRRPVGDHPGPSDAYHAENERRDQWDSRKSSMSWADWARNVYSWTWKPIIRPPREIYNLSDLGKLRFTFKGKSYCREDLAITNYKGERLACSHFRRHKHNQGIKQNCVVYLHGSSSSRLESFDVLPLLLPAGVSVVCFDFAGSGQSDGEYITLGYHEQHDLRAVLEHLRTFEHVGAIGCWGRSMGATALVMRAAEDHDIAAVVVDSAYSSLKDSIIEFIQNHKVPIPSFLQEAVVELVRTEVRKRAHFDILDVRIPSVESATCPALFAVASDDNFISPHHTQEIHNLWGGERSVRLFEGGHNGKRPRWYLDEATTFLVDKLSAWKPAGHVREISTVSTEEAKRRAYWL